MTDFIYKFPKADNTVDLVIFGLDRSDQTLKILLIERGRKGEPFEGFWALPGGFLEMELDQTLEAAAVRELQEETGLDGVYIEQLATFGDVGRDPRGRVVSTAYMALVRPEDVTVKAGDDARKASWFPVNWLDLEPDHKGSRTMQARITLAFDHHKIVKAGLDRLRSKVRWQPVGIELLPERFTLGDLQRVYEAILGQKLDKRGFRRKALRFGVLVNTGRREATGGGRRGPGGQLYRFDRRKYDRMTKDGLDFEV